MPKNLARPTRGHPVLAQGKILHSEFILLGRCLTILPQNDARMDLANLLPPAGSWQKFLKWFFEEDGS